MKFAEIVTPATEHPECNAVPVVVIVDSHETELIDEAETLGTIARPCYLDEFFDGEPELHWPRDRFQILHRARQLGHGFLVA